MLQKWMQQDIVTKWFSLFIFVLAVLYVVSMLKKSS